MNRLETLKELKRTVEREGVTMCAYVYKGERCAIGHLLSIAGYTDEELHDLTENSDNTIRNYFVNGTIREDELPFTLEELETMQNINDADGDKTDVLEYIDELMKGAKTV